jgi:hypothetical protein
VRQRQRIGEMQAEMLEYEGRTKALLYERTAALAEKDKEIFGLKEENIEVEKIYMLEREKLRQRENKHLRDLTRLFQ